MSDKKITVSVNPRDISKVLRAASRCIQANIKAEIFASSNLYCDTEEDLEAFNRVSKAIGKAKKKTR